MILMCMVIICKYKYLALRALVQYIARCIYFGFKLTGFTIRVTCGNSTRNGIEQPDRFLMVYDLRILRAISPIPIHVPPYQLRFLPSMSSRIAVVSSLGQVQLVDTAALISPQTNMFQGNN